ncbi:MAG: acetylglucosamine transferase [Methylomonas sp.]|jgi:predicted O-linked N-acetylglucosamine transferase (SPINDLY family)|uniref:O-linked N-acetylglucosamine transferase, SPINDLY family protein n=1 Tax=Methylomonas sp. TaxID=418 RepID=UPI0025CFEE61|nr:tetratricopeptide repeat protein [Methylomonas sp.]MCK9605428.1 acetylglucosamine transferase [Methylomonas sp.]
MPGLENQFATLVLNAWQGKLEFNLLLGEAEKLEKSGLAPLVAVLYQTWLRRNQTPYNHIVLFNLGTVLFNQADLSGAKEAYLQAMKLAPAFVQPHFNLGLIHEREGKIDAAVEEWRWIDDHVPPNSIEHRPLLLLALNNLGRVLENNKQYGSALDYLTRSLALEAQQPDVIHHWVYLREKQCAWPVYAPVNGVSSELMRQSTSALAMLSLSDDPEAQLAAARHYVEHKLRKNLPRLAATTSYGHNKIRIGYCSSDFCLHPVAMLTAELFELHDRAQFEVYGYCWTQQGHSPLRQRIIDAMDHFERIESLTDEAAAKLIRDQEIDILVDLHGQTLGARADLLAYRPAPIQITYLGLPATTGLPSIDYVIADRFLIPEEYACYYSETPLYMPDVYQVSDRQRKINPAPSRESCKLPAEGFVFCSFNNNYKFTPELFEVWMNILRRVPDSVLWLLADNPWSEINLRNHAKNFGIDPNRLIFAPRVAPEDYLARYAVADLFLDSFPFNAGTTANDALWMGLPVLTLTGRSFASRMAGALLTAADLPELITYDLLSYESKAVELAQSPEHCVRLKAHLQKVRTDGVLFDTPRFVDNLEQHFKRLVTELN